MKTRIIHKNGISLTFYELVREVRKRLNKLKLTLLVGCLFCSSGIVSLFVPFLNSRSIIDIYGKLGILEDTYFANTEIFPMFSTHQVINVHICAYNGSFSLIIMEDDEFYNWVEDRPYTAFFFSNNLTYFNKKIDVSALNSWPYLRFSLVIEPEDFLVITGNLSIEYLNHYFVALTSLSFGSIAFICNFYLRHKLRKRVFPLSSG